MQQRKTLFRWLFILLSVVIISLILWNTYSFFDVLKQNERNKMNLWAEAQRELQEGQIDPNFQFSNIVPEILNSNTTTPMVIHIHSEDIYDYRNINLNIKDTTKLRLKLIALSKEFSQEYKPLEVTYNNKLLSTIYYGNSPIINKLKFYPAALILIILLFFTALYFFYRTAKSSDQNKLWAGMAKETAHQIGTPLSSLVGWTEILKTEHVNPEYITEIEKDIDRLETITERFSKIGSVPTLTKTDLTSETVAAYDYLKSRSSKLITFNLDVPEHPIWVQLNPQLYSWTIENLVKNAIDAMKGKGDITVAISSKKGRAFVEVSDTGKGIPKRNYKKVFQPGFTTKKRGWGLGLSLVKRIIEEYHKGKIRVVKSAVNKGTTMRISLREIN